jgi:hypothetical protein
MKKLLILLLLSSMQAVAQLAGVGQLGCPGTAVTGAVWNSGTAQNTVQTTGPVAASGITVVLDQTSTLTAGAITFLGDYGDGNFVNIPAFPLGMINPLTNGSLANPYTLVASTNQPFFIPMTGINRLQLQLSTAITGTGTVTPFVTLWCGPTFLPNATTNEVQLNGIAIAVNSGNKSAGTQRVVIATDQPALTNKLLVTPDANVKVNVVGNAGANLDAATGAAPPANAMLDAGLGSGATGGFLVGRSVGDTYKAINISTATTTLIVTGVSGRQVRITAQHMVTSVANNVAWIEGTGATCGTGTAGMAGGTTAASGYNFPANGGLTQGTGSGTVLQTVTTGDSVCLVTSAAAQLSGGIEYTIY